MIVIVEIELEVNLEKAHLQETIAIIDEMIEV